MNIYVESNFVLELVFEQEQCFACEQILALSEQDRVQLVLPAYCLAEPHEKLGRQSRSRKELQQHLEAELRQLSRNESYKSRITSIQNIASLLIESSEQELQRMKLYRDRLLKSAIVIPLTPEILRDAADFETPLELSSQDSLVYASVTAHLQETKPATSCFLNRNSKDFNNPNIVDALAKCNCTMIPSFMDGLAFALSRLPP